MKLSLLFTLIIIGSTVAQIKIGMISDPDGYVNVRKDPGSKSKIADTIKENEFFEYVENESDWWWITKLNGNKGFVHKSRIKEKFRGIIFKNKAYNEKEYCINIDKINWNNLLILLVKIKPKPGFRDKEIVTDNLHNLTYTGIVESSAQIRIYSKNSEINRLEYFNIDAVGGYAGVSIPKKQKLDKFLFGCKYGDYNGRLIQIDTLGKINTYPGGNFLITPDKKYAITTWDSDLTGITVIDLHKGKKYFEKELDFDEELGEWYKKNGEYFAYRTDDNSEEPDKILKINLKDKSIKKLKMYHDQLKKYTKIDLMDDYSNVRCSQ